MTRTVSVNEKCPCESGKKYKNCCLKKKIVWLENDDGRFSRQVRLSEQTTQELKKFIESQSEEFRKIFGREMGPEDPIFFQLLYSKHPNDIVNQTVEIMRKAKIRPEIIYAYKKTEFLLSENNIDKIPENQIKEWKQAIDEYFQKIKHGENPFQDEIIPPEIEELIDELSNIDLLISHIDSRKENFHVGINILDTFLFHIKKTKQNLKSIKSLLETTDHGGDAVSISRTIYESYLLGIYAKKHPNRIKSGKRESKKSMAESSNYLEDKELHQLYDFFSSYSHPDISTSFSYFEIDLNRTHPLFLESLFFSLMYSALILKEFEEMDGLDQITKQDISNNVQRIKSKLLNLLEKIK